MHIYLVVSSNGVDQMVTGRQMPRPSEKEFTSVGSALKWVMLPTCTNGMLGNLIELAIEPKAPARGAAHQAIHMGGDVNAAVPGHHLDEGPDAASVEMFDFLKSLECRCNSTVRPSH